MWIVWDAMSLCQKPSEALITAERFELQQVNSLKIKSLLMYKPRGGSVKSFTWVCKEFLLYNPSVVLWLMHQMIPLSGNFLEIDTFWMPDDIS